MQKKSLWIYVHELSIFYKCNFFFIKLDTFELLCKIIHSLSLTFILTILCRTPRGRIEHVCKTLMRSINASAKRDRSIGPKILPFADAYRRDDVTLGEKTGQPHLARVGYAWTINGPSCNQRDYKRCSLNAPSVAIINARQIGQPCRFCK